MANGKIAYDNLAQHEDTVVTATSEATGFEKENAVNWNLYDSWKGTDLNENRLIFDLGSEKDIDYFALFGHDIVDFNGSVNFQYSDVGTSGPWVDITNSELIINGDFPSNVNDWDAGTGITLAHSTLYYPNGSMKVTMGATSPAGGSQDVTTVIGKTYVVSCDAYTLSANTAFNAATISISASGAAVGDGESDQVTAEDVSQSLSFQFTATSTTTTIYTYVLNRDVAWGSSGDIAYFDNISIRLSKPDKSAIFETFSSVTKRYFSVLLGSSGGSPVLSVVSFGEHLELLKGFRVGFNPVGLRDDASLTQNVSEDGIPLGHSTIVKATKNTISQTNTTESWVRSDWVPFLDAAKDHPFFLLWDEDNFPDEAVFAWIEQPANPRFTMTDNANRFMSVSVSIMSLHEL